MCRQVGLPHNTHSTYLNTIAKVSCGDKDTSVTNAVKKLAECLHAITENTGEALAPLWVSEYNNGFDALASYGGQLGGSKVCHLCTLTSVWN